MVKQKEKRKHGKLRHRWEHHNKINLKETGWQLVDWFQLAQVMDTWVPLAKAVMNVRSP